MESSLKEAHGPSLRRMGRGYPWRTGCVQICSPPSKKGVAYAAGDAMSQRLSNLIKMILN